MEAHPWPKNCGCGAVWSREAWSKLPYLARWKIEGGPTHELRHCHCHTTLAIDVAWLDGADPARSDIHHDTLAHLLAERKDELLSRWTQRVLAEVPEANPQFEPALRHDVPIFIDDLIATLLEDGVDSRRLRALTTKPGRKSTLRMAKRNLRALLREWASFRAALIDLCEHAKVALDAGRSRIVHRAIDEAVLRSASELHELPSR